MLDLNAGNNVTTVQRTNSSENIEISSLYIDGNGVTWINLHTNASSGYSELISYDLSSGNSTTYKQDGVAYFYQFVDSSKGNYWYGIAFKTYITEAALDGMDYISILNVTTASGGLITADEVLNELTTFPDVNTWETVTNLGTLDNPALNVSYNISTSSTGLPVELVPNITDNTGSNSTTDTGDNSTDTGDNSTDTGNNSTSTNSTQVDNNSTQGVDSNSTENSNSSAQSSNSTESENTTTNSTVEMNVTTTAEVASTSSVAVTSATVGVAAVANVVSSTTAVSRAGTGAAGGTSSSGSSQSVWAMINFYQEILLLPMLGTYIGNDFLYYITEFELAIFDFQFLKFIEVPVCESGPSLLDLIDYEQPDELFADNEFESGSAFFNCFQIIKAMLIFLILNMIFLVFR